MYGRARSLCWGGRIVTDRMEWRRIGSLPGVSCNSLRNRVARKSPSSSPTYSSQTPRSLHRVTTTRPGVCVCIYIYRNYIYMYIYIYVTVIYMHIRICIYIYIHIYYIIYV